MLNNIRYTYASQGNFIDPFRIAADPTSGQVYVADYANERIHVFDRNGTFLAVIQPGSGSSPLGSVADIEVNSNGTLCVLAQKVYMFDSMGVYQGEWGRVGNEEGELNGASSMAIDSEGNVYLASGTDYTIKKFTSDGQYLLEWKSDDPIQDPTTASPPSNIAIGPDDRIYVMDTHFARLEVFTGNGQYLYLWNSSLSADDGSTYYSPFDPSSITPVSVDLDANNNVYISYTGGLIRKFSSNGTFITQIGPEITNETRAWWIPDMAIDNQFGQLYMIDGNNQRIAAFRSDMGIAQIPEFSSIVLPVLVIVGMVLAIAVSRLLTTRPRFMH
jgi:DNA-binding beta-propeller fold protein YncE